MGVKVDGLPVARLAIGRPLALGPLRLSTDGGAPRQSTRVELLDDGERLSVLFHCVDSHPWATLTGRDDDLWTEEVVEVFVAPGAQAPTRYFEIEVNPGGAVLDARIGNPRGDRSHFEVDRAWTCAHLDTAAERTEDGWRARVSIPWSSIAEDLPTPRTWRLNLFRIDRPERSPAEFSAWSPTLLVPPDFHRPDRFGILERLG